MAFRFERVGREGFGGEVLPTCLGSHVRSVGTVPLLASAAHFLALVRYAVAFSIFVGGRRLLSGFSVQSMSGNTFMYFQPYILLLSTYQTLYSRGGDGRLSICGRVHLFVVDIRSQASSRFRVGS